MDGMTELTRVARGLLRQPGFTGMALLTLGLGIGGSVAVFSVVQAVLLRPLPYEDPESLVLLRTRLPAQGTSAPRQSPRDMAELAGPDGVAALSDLEGIIAVEQALTEDGGDAEHVRLAIVSHGLPELLGVTPVVGRGFTPEDGVPNEVGAAPGDPGFREQRVLLSHPFWMRRYGGDGQVMGRRMEIGGFPSRVVGVLPPDFRLYLPPDAVVPEQVDVLAALRVNLESPGAANPYLTLLGRTAPGVGAGDLARQLDRASQRLRNQSAEREAAGFQLTAAPLGREVGNRARTLLLILFAAVGFVLLVACANTANLLMVRSLGRERDASVRMALGAGRIRVARRILAESVLLAGGGALLGLAWAWLGIRLVVGLRPAGLPRLEEVALDAGVMAFALALALLTAFLSGLVPALRASRLDVAGALKGRTTGGTGRSAGVVRDGLVVVEVGLALILLVGAGLMARSFGTLLAVEPGYRVEGVLSFRVPIPFFRFPGSSARASVREALRERLRVIPGVTDVSVVSSPPLAGTEGGVGWAPAEGAPEVSSFEQGIRRVVDPSYFDLMGTRIIQGRSPTWEEFQDSASVAVVDRTLADEAFPGEDAVGRELVVRLWLWPEPQPVRIVGVTEPQHLSGLGEDPRPTVFLSDSWVGNLSSTWLLRTDGGAPPSARTLREAVSEVDPGLPMADLRPLRSYLDEDTAETRFALLLIGGFAGIAGALALVGIYGVLTQLVRQRRSEIALRMAVGAGRWTVVGMVLRRALLLASVGVLTGVGAALLLTNFMEALVVGVPTTDPFTFATTSALLVLAAVLAALGPAYLAARADPADLLRSE